MAKSARSKSKIRNRNTLRSGVFGQREAERIQRLAAKQQVTSGTTADLMDADKPAAPAATASEDVEMTESSKPAPIKRVKRGNKDKPKRVIVRNHKGRILSKTQVTWVKQRRFKN